MVSKYVERRLGNINERLSKIKAALALLDITREDLSLKLPDSGDMFDDEGTPSTTTLLRKIKGAAECVDALNEQELSGDSPPVCRLAPDSCNERLRQRARPASRWPTVSRAAHCRMWTVTVAPCVVGGAVLLLLELAVVVSAAEEVLVPS